MLLTGLSVAFSVQGQCIFSGETLPMVNIGGKLIWQQFILAIFLQSQKSQNKLLRIISSLTVVSENKFSEDSEIDNIVACIL